MAEIRIGVRVAFGGRPLKVVPRSKAAGVDPGRVFVEDEVTGERFVITTRVLSVRDATPRSEC